MGWLYRRRRVSLGKRAYSYISSYPFQRHCDHQHRVAVLTPQQTHYAPAQMIGSSQETRIHLARVLLPARWMEEPVPMGSEPYGAVGFVPFRYSSTSV